ncbi:hypothetical protein BJ878DRAFT_557440 [Calycina marina]|uniref:C3H1-type domain-containing protein n=1 Tax=Calycina marina TaxID=1763456 RepID=A0A9P7Z968_9HELO|nr:hypothetical protein BJ878DRAFT_557440 [Calycina marina]
MTWASESKDPNSGNRVGSRPVPITADHQKLQSNYTSTIRQLKSDRSKLCMGFLQRVCDNSNCQFQHDEVARNSYVQEKSKLLRYYGYNATASGKLLCGFFSTGSICLRNPCPYVHEAGVRKVMLSKKIPPIWNNPLTCANWDALRDDPDPAAVQYLSWDVPGIDSHWNAERDDPDPAAVQYLVSRNLSHESRFSTPIA